MGSLTLWHRLYDAPDDGRVWTDFRTHYVGPVYNWALRRLKDPAAAQDVTEAVFVKLYARVRSGRAGRVRPADAGTYKPYVYAVVRTAVVDYYESVRYFDAADGPRRLPEVALADLIDPASLDDLEQGIRDYAEYEADLEQYAAAYRAAVGGPRADTRHDPRGFGVFLRVFGSPVDGAAAAIDRACGWSRGMASKHTARVRDRLLALMGLPAADPRSENVLKLMVLRHGDPSDPGRTPGLPG